MKYIKLFEDLNESEYEKIERDEYYDDSGTLKFTPVNFTNLEINKLESLGLTLDHYLKLIPVPVQEPGDVGYKSIGIFKFFNKMDNYRASLSFCNAIILKAEDEWYYITTDFTRNYTIVRYKCDQFDGLLACLKKEFDIS